MPVIAVINRKGGSGKSTLATHLAAYLASQHLPVMLGDVDRQQSAQAWLKLRGEQPQAESARIVGWAVDPRNVLRPPAGIRHVVLDTPGGLRDFDLARVVVWTDAILMPLCNSMFDRQSAAQCYAELQTLPRVASGRCRVAAVGMRLDARTKGCDALAKWAEDIGLPFIGALRETQAYVRCVERGLTLFDMNDAKVQGDLLQWRPIIEWLRPTLESGAEEFASTTTRPGRLPDRAFELQAEAAASRARREVRRPARAPEHASEDAQFAQFALQSRRASPLKDRLLDALPFLRLLRSS